MRPKQELPRPDELLCRNCKHFIHAGALGLGKRCSLTNTVLKSEKTCNKFEKK
jgi:hypothetical protein